MAMADETDDDLLRRYIRTADRSAMDELVRRHVDLVYAAARRQVFGDAHAAEDVTQAVFMLLLSKAKSIPPGRLAGWLIQTTRYTAANARRVFSRRTHHEQQAAAGRSEAIVSPTEQPLLLNLDKSLASLRPIEREVVVLRYLEEIEMPEVCNRLGLTEAAGRKRLARAIDRLRKLLTEKGSAPIGESAALALLHFAATDKAPVAFQAMPTHVPAAIVTQVFKETAMKMLWMKIRFVGVTAFLSVVVLTTVHEIAHRAYADKPAIQPVEDIAAASTQPINPHADMMRDEMNMVNIGGAINSYAVNNDSRLPASLGQTFQYIEQRTAWAKDSQPKATTIQKASLYLSPADLRTTQIPNSPSPRWIDANTSYVYLIPPGMKMADIPAKDVPMTAIAHVRLDAGYPTVRPDKVPDTIIPVLFLDGHVEAEIHSFAEQVIDESKKRFSPGSGGL
jgi:RNA polymerase sigma factor (sigma-70 family)